MSAFIESLDDQDRVSFTRWFCQRRYDTAARPRRSHVFPLARAVVIPVLVTGASRGDPDCVRWLLRARFDPDLGMHLGWLDERSRTQGLLAAALATNPDAADVWHQAFHFELEDAEWGTHHLLDDGVLTGPIEDCLRSVRRARYVYENAPPGVMDDEYLEDLRFQEGLLSDYQSWSESAAKSPFPEWRKERGRPIA